MSVLKNAPMVVKNQKSVNKKYTWIIEALLSIPKPVRPRVFVVFVGVVGRRKLQRVVLPWQKRLFVTGACSERPLSL